MNRAFYKWALVSVCLVLSACSSSKKAVESPLVDVAALSAQWMADNEAVLRDSIKGSPFTLHQQDNAWVVTAPAQVAFNPDRPALLMPAMLRPITRLAKMLEAQPESAVLILGHADLDRDARISHKLSADRARSVASIFRLSGLTSSRMTQLGLGSSHMLEMQKNNDKNHRVEIIISQRLQMKYITAMYHPAYMRQLALSQAQ